MAATGGSDPTNGRCFTLGSIMYIYIYINKILGEGEEKKRFVFIVKFVYVNRRRLLVES